MDITLSGKLVIKSDEETLDLLQNVFIDEYEGDEEELLDLAYAMGDLVDEEDLENNGETLTVPFDQSYYVIKSYDFSKDVIDFVKKLLELFPEIETLTFEGRYECWSSDEFIRFACEYNKEFLTIAESNNYNECIVHEDMSYEDILDEYGWDANMISEEFIDSKRGKTLYKLDLKEMNSEDDLVEEMEICTERDDLKICF